MRIFLLSSIILLLFSCKESSITILRDVVEEFNTPKITLSLPAEDNGEYELNKNVVTISLDENGDVLFDGNISKQLLNKNNLSLLKSLAELELENNEQIIFSIEIVPESKYSDYLLVLDYLKQAKATKISVR